MIEPNQFYTADCVEFMARMEAGSVDLTVTSPPYDSMRSYKGYDFNYQSIIQGLWRVTKPGGVVVWIVADETVKGDESGNSFRQALYFKEVGFKLFDTMIYAKTPNGAYGSPRTYWGCFEYAFVCSKGMPKTINLIRDRENKTVVERDFVRHRRKDGTIRLNPFSGMDKLGRRTNIWEYSTGKNISTRDKIAHKHPAIFPEKLAHDHVISWSNEGDLVFDPMSGSGTTCKVAKLSNRQYIGVDISDEYTAIAKQRLNSLLL